YIQAQDLEGNPLSYGAAYGDLATENNVTNAAIYLNGGLAFTIVPGYAGPLKFYVSTSHDEQLVVFAVGDSAISAIPTNFIARPRVLFVDQILA
ncbi:hypothetical protein, partial [Vibrio parahaemolyticus]|uniref:hypothetical protein n=1 Tax=Vibrio parahaemolyticus TaxID=670 RepID=UPI0021133061